MLKMVLLHSMILLGWEIGKAIIEIYMVQVSLILRPIRFCLIATDPRMPCALADVDLRVFSFARQMPSRRPRFVLASYPTLCSDRAHRARHNYNPTLRVPEVTFHRPHPSSIE